MKVLITGMSGVGKTTTLAELQKYGYLVIDVDATGICVWKNHKTKEKVEYGPDGRDSDWLTEHGWYCDIGQLSSFLSYVRENKHVFVSGFVENMTEFSKIFDKVIILELEKDKIIERLNQRTNNHFAKKKEEQDFIFNSQNNLFKKIQNTISINTNVTPKEVADKILDLI
jgi:broad-specificity NMP kinase